jgi:hypothetical protein
MEFLEKDLEQIIYEASSDELQERGLYLGGKLYRQLRIGNYGIADLVEFRRPRVHDYFKHHKIKGLINVIELKKEKVGISAFLQALGYLKGIKRYLEKRDMHFNYNYSITLIGSEVDSNSTFIYLPDMFYMDTEKDIDHFPDFELSLYKYKYKLDGIHFEIVEGYKLINEGF